MATQEEKTARYQNRVELLQGTLDMLILQTLQMGSAAWIWHQPGHPHALGRGAAG